MKTVQIRADLFEGNLKELRAIATTVLNMVSGNKSDQELGAVYNRIGELERELKDTDAVISRDIKSVKGFNMQQNISLKLGNRGHTLSIAQGLVGGGSQRNHHVEVALLDGTGENLLFVIAKAQAWVGRNQ